MIVVASLSAVEVFFIRNEHETSESTKELTKTGNNGEEILL